MGRGPPRIQCEGPPRPSRRTVWKDHPRMSQTSPGHPASPESPPPPESSALRVAVLGAGTVGTEVLRLIAQQREDLAHRIGAHLTVTGIAVRDLTRDRGEHVPAELLTEDASE